MLDAAVFAASGDAPDTKVILSRKGHTMNVLISIAGLVNLTASILTILMFAWDCIGRFRQRERRRRRKKMMGR